MARGSGCPRDAPVRSYRVVAINVDITLNRYLDHDPDGRMYVLEQDLARVRKEEAQNAAARAGKAEPAVSAGLGQDAIQPLTLRVNQGECLRITLRNDLRGDESASFHLHESELVVAEGGAAIATNPRAMADGGATVNYEWMVSRREPEGTHYFHSHGNFREQTSHGLFGAVVVEPAGSAHLDPVRGRPVRSGWAAIIRDPKGSDFREFALYYHEIGDESYQFLDKDGGFVPLVDSLTNAYRPAARALNYRSEPFMNRLKLQNSMMGKFDESVAYSSYVFGDPATPIMRSYVGDPAKERVIHGGSEVSHVHHVHGGSVRWRRQPGTESSGFDQGLNKRPPIRPKASERTDSQTIGPSETFDVENECGSGGCQQSVGDFLFHCHVAQHYFAGMWGLWRVYNTLQGAAVADLGEPLSELPDREGGVKPAVSSVELIDKTVDWNGKTFKVDRPSLSDWVEQQLPTPGVPKGYDASVLDWRREGDLYLNEPETGHSWPGYRPSSPETRPPFLFDPITGKLAYPHLRPHLGKRPPFAPNHGPAPFLDPSKSKAELPKPGENGPASVCPEGTTPKSFSLQAITLPITLNQRAALTDPAGEIFVLKHQEDQVRADNRMRVPLAVRANAGEHCIDVLLRSELEDSPENHGFSKVNAHIHFVQFDVQASDGVISGFNYEQAVRPFALEGEKLRTSIPPGATSVTLSSAARFQPGVMVGVGMDQDETFELATIKDISGDTVVFDAPLRHPHAQDEIVSTEFVRYRWYPDAQFGTAYFHDHVNAISSWKHGLFGALVSEPPGSTYHHPHSGDVIESGPVADIHSHQPLSADVAGSFRELVLFIQDDNPLSHIGRSTGSSFNLRVEPLEARGGEPSQLFSSQVHGDPETPVLESFVGDPVVFRTLVAGTNDVHTFHVDGHWFRTELFSKSSPPVSTASLGISERFDLVVPRAGGPQSKPGDYLYYNGRSFKLREGSWGILRVRDRSDGGGLRPLPGTDARVATGAPVCPSGASRKHFAVSVAQAPLPMLDGAMGRLYVLEAEKQKVLSGAVQPQPLVLHVNVGDCITMDLSNETNEPASIQADMLAHDPRTGGVAAGLNPGQTVRPGGTGSFTYYAHPEIGETTALISDWGSVLQNPRRGLYGAIVVGPKGAVYRNPKTGKEVSGGSGWVVDVIPPTGSPYRDFALFLQDEDAGIGNHRMPYSKQVSDVVALNYNAEPLVQRLEDQPQPAAVFRPDIHADPTTPLLEAAPRQAVKIHLLAPWSEQTQVFSIEGHRWQLEPGRRGTDRVSSVTVGGRQAVILSLEGGAGGSGGVPGDYLYGDHRGPYLEAGLWGIFRVRHSEARSDAGSFPYPQAAVVLGLVALIVLWRRGKPLR